MSPVTPAQARLDPLFLEQVELRDHACVGLRRCTQRIARCSVGIAILQASPASEWFRAPELRLSLEPDDEARLRQARLQARRRLGAKQIEVPKAVVFSGEAQPWPSAHDIQRWVGGWIRGNGNYAPSHWRSRPLWTRLAVSATPGVLNTMEIAMVQIEPPLDKGPVGVIGTASKYGKVYQSYPARPGDVLHAMSACDAALWPSLLFEAPHHG